MKFWGEEIPDLTTRWYSELFLGNVIDKGEALTFNDKCLNGEEIVGANIVDILERLYNGDEILEDLKAYCREYILI
jgi:hypothetical protein